MCPPQEVGFSLNLVISNTGFDSRCSAQPAIYGGRDTASPLWITHRLCARLRGRVYIHYSEGRALKWRKGLKNASALLDDSDDLPRVRD